jgi:hypothetical protein
MTRKHQQKHDTINNSRFKNFHLLQLYQGDISDSVDVVTFSIAYFLSDFLYFLSLNTTWLFSFISHTKTNE